MHRQQSPVPVGLKPRARFACGPSRQMGSSASKKASKKKAPKPRGFDPPPAPPREHRLKGWPALTSELYVDPEVGSARNDGSKEKPFDTIMNALKVAGDNTAIYLAAGVYRNHRFGSGDVGNPAVATVQNVNNILLTAVDGARPRIEFDGAGGHHALRHLSAERPRTGSAGGVVPTHDPCRQRRRHLPGASSAPTRGRRRLDVGCPQPLADPIGAI